MSLLEFSKVYKPFNYPEFVELWNTHEEIHWHHGEVDLSEDVFDWTSKLSLMEKNHIKQILRLFTQSDVAVGKNYYDFIIPKFKNNEVRNMLGSFAAREAIHQAAYALLNETLGFPDSDWSAFVEYSQMSNKMDFMMDNKGETYSDVGITLAKSVFNEGVSLFASFAMLLNYQRFGKMKGMCTIVEWSIRDEQLHVEGISKLFRTFCEEHSKIVNDDFKKKIYDMARRIVELEDKFIDLAYEMGDIEGLKKKEVKEFIRYMTDRRLIQLGLKGNFNVKKNPLKWLDFILNGENHSNFFEKRVTNYSVNSITGDWSVAWDKQKF
jgi:ribonucleotide reductase beta subunit family protein with ferritin-like domain